MVTFTDDKKSEIDALDEKILEMLRLNSRFTNNAIASVLKVSEGTIRRRIRILQEKKVIKRFTIETKDQKEAIVLLKYDFNMKREIMEAISKVSGGIYEVSGKSDLAIVIPYRSLVELNEIIDNIRDIKGIKNSETMIRLK